MFDEAFKSWFLWGIVFKTTHNYFTFRKMSFKPMKTFRFAIIAGFGMSYFNWFQKLRMEKRLYERDFDNNILVYGELLALGSGILEQQKDRVKMYDSFFRIDP